MTNMWLSLLSTVIGGVIAIVGTTVGSHIQNRHTARARQEQYAREDKYRLFDKRQSAYVQLYLQIGDVRRALAILARQEGSSVAKAEALNSRNEYWSAYTAVRLIGSTEVYKIANDILAFFDECLEKCKFDQDSFRSLLKKFTLAARRELLMESENDLTD